MIVSRMGAQELVNPERFRNPYTGNYIELSRVKFDGSYTLKGTTRRPYPMIFAELGEEYEAGVRLKFRIYVKSDVSESLSLKSTLRGFMGNSSESVNYNTNISLNEWNEVDITFKTAHDRFSFFLELDGTPITADSKSAEIYYDDFRIQEYTTMEKTEWNVDKEDSTEFESWLNR